MNYWYQQPQPDLSSIIRTVLIIDGAAGPGTGKLPLVTTGMPAMFCKIKKDNIELLLFGKSVPDEYWVTDDSTLIIAYFFLPFTMAAVFNIPAKKLNEEITDTGNWNAHKTHALKIQLIHAATALQKVDVLDNFLVQQLKENKKEYEIIRNATDEIMYNPGKEILAEMLKKLELNERTFQRIFKKYVGVTPNQYRRICQFQLSFFQLKSKDFGKLTDIAYDSGFADQSHFIRSFKEFTQTTPNDYLKSGLKDQND